MAHPLPRSQAGGTRGEKKAEAERKSKKAFSLLFTFLTSPIVFISPGFPLRFHHEVVGGRWGARGMRHDPSPLPTSHNSRLKTGTNLALPETFLNDVTLQPTMSASPKRPPNRRLGGSMRCATFPNPRRTWRSPPPCLPIFPPQTSTRDNIACRDGMHVIIIVPGLRTPRGLVDVDGKRGFLFVSIFFIFYVLLFLRTS